MWNIYDQNKEISTGMENSLMITIILNNSAHNIFLFRDGLHQASLRETSSVL